MYRLELGRNPFISFGRASTGRLSNIIHNKNNVFLFLARGSHNGKHAHPDGRVSLWGFWKYSWALVCVFQQRYLFENVMLEG